MPRNRTTLALALATAALLATALRLAPARATQGGISLLQTLEPWKYPGSDLLGGASMSDGGNPDVEDVTCRAILTTPDPVADVARFYEARAGEAPAGRAVVTQDDSLGRPVAVRVVSVLRADTATTIVISRGEREERTHVAWSHHIRLPNPR